MPLSKYVVAMLRLQVAEVKLDPCPMKGDTENDRKCTGSLAAHKLVQTNGFVYCISQLLQSGSYDGGKHENKTARTPASSGNPA